MSNSIRPKRRVRSSDRPRCTVMPPVPAGTRTCVSPSPVRADTRNQSATARRLHVALRAAEHDVGALDVGGELHPGLVPGARGFGERPGGDGPPGEQAREHRRLLRVGARHSASAAATTLTGRNGPGATIRPISSATMTASAVAPPDSVPPPWRSGTNSDVQPSSAAFVHQTRSNPSFESQSSRTLVSGLSDSRNRRVVSRKNSWSSVSSRFTVRPRCRGTRRGSCS